MPYFDERLSRNFSAVNVRAIEQAATELETARAAPVRVIAGTGDRFSIENHNHWRGYVRSERYYSVPIADHTFAESGITWYINAYPELYIPGHEAEWTYATFAPDEVLEARNARGEETESCELELLRFTDEAMDEFLSAHPEVSWQPIELDDINGNTARMGELFDNGRLIFAGFGVQNLNYWGIAKWKELFCDPAVLLGDPNLMREAAERQAEASRQAFIRMMEDRGDATITECRKARDNYAIEVAKAQEAIVIAEGNRNSYDRQLEYLLDQLDGDELTDAMVNEEWEGITRNVNVDHFLAGENRATAENVWGEREGGREVPNPYLKVFTKHLWLTNPESGRKLPLGEFEVTMNFGTNQLRIKNLTRRGSREGLNWDHPHVRESRLCSAEYTTAITTLLRDRKLANMTNMMFTILGTVTLNDPWGRNNIRIWEQMDDEERQSKGWSPWSADEDEHPLAILMQEEQAAREAAAEAAQQEQEQQEDVTNE